MLKNRQEAAEQLHSGQLAERSQKAAGEINQLSGTSVKVSE